MEEKILKISYKSYNKWSELSEEYQKLARKAEKITKTSHAPYSNFNVGAACLLANGEILAHANFENAAYPMCLCAERALIAAAHSKFPNVAIKAMFVTAKSGIRKVQDIITPCGACRHVLVEVEQFQQQTIDVLCSCETEETIQFQSASQLLPFALSKNDLL